jgi:hypothetical protein
VPTEERRHTHGNKTKSVAFLRILVPRDVFATRAKEFEAIIGSRPSSTKDLEYEWVLTAPRSDGSTPPRLLLSAAKQDDEDEQQFVSRYGSGLYQLGFLVAEGGGSNENDTPYSRIVWVPAERS